MSESETPVRLATNQRKIIYDEQSASLAYLGAAAAGSSAADPFWRIQRITYGPGNSFSIAFADGNVEFDNVWDDRASLAYS